MELGTEVLIHNQQLGLKGAAGTLLQIGSDGFYEVKCSFGDSVHRVLLPIQGTIIIAREPELKDAAGPEIER
jgi:hypothetical protein